MEYKSPPLKTIQLKSLVLQLRGGRPGKEQGQLAVKDTDPDYLRILTNYPQQAEYIRNKNRLSNLTTIKIYSDKELTKLLATIKPEQIPNNLKRPEMFVASAETDLSALAAAGTILSKTTEEKVKAGALEIDPALVAAGAGNVLTDTKPPVKGSPYPFRSGPVYKTSLLNYENDPLAQKDFLWSFRFDGKSWLFEVYRDRFIKIKQYSDEQLFTKYIGEQKGRMIDYDSNAPKQVKWYDKRPYDPETLSPPDHPLKPKPAKEVISVPSTLKWYDYFDYGDENSVKVGGIEVGLPQFVGFAQDVETGDFFAFKPSGKVLGKIEFKKGSSHQIKSLDMTAEIPEHIREWKSQAKRSLTEDVEYKPLSKL